MLAKDNETAAFYICELLDIGGKDLAINTVAQGEKTLDEQIV